MAMIKELATPITQPSIDKAKLLFVQVDPFGKSLQVQVARGFETDGTFDVKSVSTHMISGADYDTLMSTAGDPAKGLGEALEGAIWTKLVAIGAIVLA